MYPDKTLLATQKEMDVDALLNFFFLLCLVENETVRDSFKLILFKTCYFSKRLVEKNKKHGT